MREPSPWTRLAPPMPFRPASESRVPAAVAGLAIAAGVSTALWGTLATLAALPAVFVIVTPMLLPSPMFLYTFGWEVSLLALGGVMLLSGWWRRAEWLWRLDDIERAL